MRVTDKETGGALWLDDESVIAIAEVAGGVEVLFRETAGEVTTYVVAENFETVINQVDPILEGDTIEEMTGSLVRNVAGLPVSLLRRLF